MEPEPSRLDQLPTDLLNILADQLVWTDEGRKASWRDLYEAYMSNPAFQRFDPNHALWRRLYHQHLSIYPLPETENYRDQFFWGMALLDESREPYQAAHLYAKLGYTVPLAPLYAEMGIMSLENMLLDAIPHCYTEIAANIMDVLTQRKVWHLVGNRTMLDQAIQVGCEPIIDLLHSHLQTSKQEDTNRWYDMARSAAKAGRYELFKKYIAEAKNINWENLIRLAAAGGNVDILNTILSHVKPTTKTYTEGLIGATFAGNVGLMDWMYQHGAKVGEEVYHAAENHGYRDVYQWLFDVYEQGPSPVDYLSRLFYNNVPLDDLRWIFDLALERLPDDFSRPGFWSTLLDQVVNGDQLEVIISHPDINPPVILRNALNKWIERRNSDLIEALLRNHPVLHHELIELMVNNDREAIEDEKMYITMLDSTEWSTQELIELLKYSIGLDHDRWKSRIDVLLSRLVGHNEEILEMLDEVEATNVNPHMAARGVISPFDASQGDVAYIRERLR